MARKAMDRDAAPADEASADAEVQHRIPVIDKMFQILELIRQSDGSATINELAKASRVPRSTVYRVLNTLADHNAVVRSGRGGYKLGFRLVSLAAGVDTSVNNETLARLAQPILQKLAMETGETSKLTILSDGAAEVLEVVLSPNAMAPSSRVGSRFALHAGAASKALLAFADERTQANVLENSMEPMTKSTIVDAQKLRLEIEDIRRTGVSYDRGEWNINVNAVATPIFDFAGRLVGAISVSYFADAEHRDAQLRLVEPLKAAAQAISGLLGFAPPPSKAEPAKAAAKPRAKVSARKS